MKKSPFRIILKGFSFHEAGQKILIGRNSANRKLLMLLCVSFYGDLKKYRPILIWAVIFIMKSVLISISSAEPSW